MEIFKLCLQCPDRGGIWPATRELTSSCLSPLSPSAAGRSKKTPAPLAWAPHIHPSSSAGQLQEKEGSSGTPSGRVSFLLRCLVVGRMTYRHGVGWLATKITKRGMLQVKGTLSAVWPAHHGTGKQMAVSVSSILRAFESLAPVRSRMLISCV